MVWDDTKVNGNTLTPDEWNDHVTDQKTRAVRGTTLTSGNIIFSNASQQLLGDTNLFWDNTNKRLGLTVFPIAKCTIWSPITDPASGVNSFALLTLGPFGGGIAIRDSAYQTDFGMWATGEILHFGCGLNNGPLTTGVTMSSTNIYIVENCSANSFTDRTPGYDGNALDEICKIKNKVKPKGGFEIDHDTMPEFARKGNERDLGAMISILTKGVQELTKRIEVLEKSA